MTVQTRRQAANCRRSWLLYPLFALMAFSAVGCGYETIQRGSDGGAAPVKGDRLVDAGGHRLNIRCIGSGSPAVVLEPGLGESASAIARRIAPQVARTTRVCVYDRAGHGRSDVAADADATRDLHVLLEHAHVPGPYVLAGHSRGGMFVLGYAHRYPTEVGGVVLLDSMYPQQTHTATDLGPVLAVVSTLARTGIARLVFDPKQGEPVDQARPFVRDVEQMPAHLNRAAQLETLGSRPLGRHGRQGRPAGLDRVSEGPDHPVEPQLPPHGRGIDAPVTDRRSERRRGFHPRHPRRRPCRRTGKGPSRRPALTVHETMLVRPSSWDT